jgi:carbonic anhydrase
VTNIDELNVRNLLPNTKNYMTYEGSMTQPGCQETATWIIFNKPLSLTERQVINHLKNIYSFI